MAEYRGRGHLSFHQVFYSQVSSCWTGQIRRLSLPVLLGAPRALRHQRCPGGRRERGQAIRQPAGRPELLCVGIRDNRVGGFAPTLSVKNVG